MFESIKIKLLGQLPDPAELARQKEEATAWCRERAIAPLDAIQAIASPSVSLETVSSKFPEVFAGARSRAEKCPIDMGGGADLDLLYWLTELSQATKVLETGVAYGWSSLAILLSLDKRPGSSLISVDMPYPRLDNDGYVGCAVPDDLKKLWEIYRCADRQGIPKALKKLGTLDMCHYDSDKSYQGRMWAYPLLWNALRPGGFFLSDDINDNFAFRDFAVQVGQTPTIISTDDKFAGVLVKPS